MTNVWPTGWTRLNRFVFIRSFLPSLEYSSWRRQWFCRSWAAPLRFSSLKHSWQTPHFLSVSAHTLTQPSVTFSFKYFCASFFRSCNQPLAKRVTCDVHLKSLVSRLLSADFRRLQPLCRPRGAPEPEHHASVQRRPFTNDVIHSEVLIETLSVTFNRAALKWVNQPNYQVICF